MRISGVFPALVTPFLSSAHGEPQIDWESWERLIEWQLSCGVQGLVIFGTTGESATLSKAEKLELARRTIAQVKNRVPVVAGTGSNNTAESVQFTKEIAAVGISAALAVAPYYNKPNQEGLYRHFVAMAESGGLPLVVYNVPGRTVTQISVDTYARLAKVPGIIACKQAVDSIAELIALSSITGGSMDLLAGDDAMFYSVLTVGGSGVISAAASVFPAEMVAIWNAFKAGDTAAALRAQQQLLPAISLLFSETNPTPAKAALVLKGIIAEDTLRLPLVPASAATKDKLAKLLQE